MGAANSVSKDSSKIGTTIRTHSQDFSSVPSSHIHRTSDLVGSAEIALEFQHNYDFIRVLGRGASAEVHLVRDRFSGIEYACKIVKKSNSMNDAKTMEAEAAIMKRLSHEHLLSLHEIYETHDTLWIVLEFADGGDLMHGLNNLEIYNERSIAKVFKQILEGVKNLHAHGIVHRDLKMDNLLYSKLAQSGSPTDSSSSSGASSPSQLTCSSDECVPIQVKIADFGLSAITDARRIDAHDSQGNHHHSEKSIQTHNKQVKAVRSLKDMWGTLEYFAPEIYAKNGYGPQVDIWALGCILFEMLTGEIAFPNPEATPSSVEKMMTHVGLQKKWKRPFELSEGWRDLSPSVQSLIKAMLKRDPLKRFDVDECLSHPWITGAEENSSMDYHYDHELRHAKTIIKRRSDRRVKRYHLLVKELELKQRKNKPASSLTSLVRM